METRTNTPYAVVFGFGVALLALSSTRRPSTDMTDEDRKAALVARCAGDRTCVDEVDRHFVRCIAGDRPVTTDAVEACIAELADRRISSHP